MQVPLLVNYFETVFLNLGLWEVLLCSHGYASDETATKATFLPRTSRPVTTMATLLTMGHGSLDSLEERVWLLLGFPL